MLESRTYRLENEFLALDKYLVEKVTKGYLELSIDEFEGQLNQMTAFFSQIYATLARVREQVEKRIRKI